MTKVRIDSETNLNFPTTRIFFHIFPAVGRYTYNNITDQIQCGDRYCATPK